MTASASRDDRISYSMVESSTRVKSVSELSADRASLSTLVSWGKARANRVAAPNSMVLRRSSRMCWSQAGRPALKTRTASDRC